MSKVYSTVLNRYYLTEKARDSAEARSLQAKTKRAEQEGKVYITPRTSDWVGSPTPEDQPPWRDS